MQPIPTTRREEIWKLRRNCKTKSWTYIHLVKDGFDNTMCGFVPVSVYFPTFSLFILGKLNFSTLKYQVICGVSLNFKIKQLTSEVKLKIHIAPCCWKLRLNWVFLACDNFKIKQLTSEVKPKIHIAPCCWKLRLNWAFLASDCQSYMAVLFNSIHYYYYFFFLIWYRVTWYSNVKEISIFTPILKGMWLFAFIVKI